MSTDISSNYTILFGGGAIRGLAYCGAVKALDELNIKSNRLAGSSVGSIFAGLIAVGYGVDEIADIIMKVNFELFKDLHFALGPNLAISKGEVFLEWIRDVIEKKFYGENYKKGTHKAVTFSDLEKDLVIITTDLSNFECKEFSKFETPDFEVATAIRISCAMPGLMKPIEYNNRVLVDGDLQKSVPMWKLSKNLTKGDERILELRLEGNFEGKDKNAIEYLNSIYSYATCSGTKFITELYGCNDKHDYVVINTGDLNLVDFNIPEERRSQLYNTGYKQTMDYFKRVLVEKKSELLKIYTSVKKDLDKIDNAIKSRKIVHAKHYLGDLYITLCENLKFIDESDYDCISQFKNVFIENLKYPALFGKLSLKNDTLVRTTLKQCSVKISDKIQGYKDYIKNFG